MISLNIISFNERINIPILDLPISNINFTIKQKNSSIKNLNNKNIFNYNSFFSSFLEHDISFKLTLTNFDEKIKLDKILEISNNNFNLVFLHNPLLLEKANIYYDTTNNYSYLEINNLVLINFLKKYNLINILVNLNNNGYPSIVEYISDNKFKIINNYTFLSKDKHKVYFTILLPYTIKNIKEMLFKNYLTLLEGRKYESEILIFLSFYNPICNSFTLENKKINLVCSLEIPFKKFERKIKAILFKLNV